MKKINKRNIISICAFVLTMFVVVGSLPTYSYASGYNVNKAVDYAQKWAGSYNNSQYKRINDDCTNFVSQCIVAGGKSFVKPKELKMSALDWVKGYKYTADSTSWYNKRYKNKKFGITKNVFFYSASFTFVDSFYSFWNKQKCCSTYGPYDNCKKNSPLQKKLKKGDIIQMYDVGNGWHHSMIITSGVKGNWKYCAHTKSEKNRDLYNLQGKNRKFRVVRINY